MNPAVPHQRQWFEIENIDEVESPALLVYPDRVKENIRRMVAIAGTPEKLRPHAKTHKLSEVASLQIGVGIKKFKAATIAEAEMLGRIGAADVLVAYQPVGPNVRRFLDLSKAFPQTAFSCLIDDLGAAGALSRQAMSVKIRAGVLLDVDCGQHRTGIPPGESAFELYEELCRLPGLKPLGLHAYDGHLHGSDPAQRKQDAEAAFAPVAELRAKMRGLGLPTNTLVVGGTPTFPMHATRPDVECSPGTCVFWDYGYSSRLPDLDFLHAAMVLTRVISKPGAEKLCLDLGHKALASENPPPRVHFLNAPSARQVGHSEEHLVVEVGTEADRKVGDCLYGVPWHICPTVALHAQAVVIENNRATTKWRIAARDRHLSV